MKDQNLFHLVNTIGNIFTCGCATRENITDGVHSMKINFDLSQKKTNILYILCVVTMLQHIYIETRKAAWNAIRSNSIHILDYSH